MSKVGYFVLAWLSLLFGVIGIVLPLLPTTPFILLAAFGFSKSSEKFHQWLLSNTLFGPMIKDWEQYGIIPFKTKLIATFSASVMLAISFYFMNLSNVVMLMIVVSMLLVFAFIWSRPSKFKKI